MSLNKTTGLALFFAALVQLNQASALPSDREQPIYIESDKADLDEKKGTAIYRGDVVITQGTLKITGDTVTVVQRPDGEVESFTAVGQPAYYEQIPDIDKDLVQAYGITIKYLALEDTVIITDQAKVVQTENVSQGEQIIYHTVNETIQAQRAPTGTVTKEQPRVNMVIQPKEKAQTSQQVPAP